jgi:hypothetical protein
VKDSKVGVAPKPCTGASTAVEVALALVNLASVCRSGSHSRHRSDASVAAFVFLDVTGGSVVRQLPESAAFTAF